jgi:hypothetical protein
MKKSIMLIMALAITMGSLFASSTNLENIYGKNDLDLNGNYVHIYGNNFGSLMESNVSQPHSMDVEVAEREIEIVTDRNNILINENAQHNQDIDGLEVESSNLYALIGKIDSLLNTVISAGTDLYTLSRTITDPEMKAELQKSVEENRQQKFDLENRQQELNRKLNSIKNQIGMKKRYITVNRLNLRRNDERIDFLRSCIELSIQDSGALEKAINRSATLQNEVDNLLSLNF